MLVIAALMMSDELYELTRRLEQAEAARTVAPEPKPDPKLTRKLNRMAKRAEDIAEGLESP